MQASPEVQFKVGDMAVYPAQGVAEVISIDEKDIAGRGQRQDAKPKARHHRQAFVNCAAFGTALNLDSGLLAHSLIGMGRTALGLPGQG